MYNIPVYTKGCKNTELPNDGASTLWRLMQPAMDTFLLNKVNSFVIISVQELIQKAECKMFLQ